MQDYIHFSLSATEQISFPCSKCDILTYKMTGIPNDHSAIIIFIIETSKDRWSENQITSILMNCWEGLNLRSGL